jgi:hypothetical protein
VKKSKGKVSKSEQIRKLYDAGKSVKEIKARVNCSHALIAIVLRNYRNKKPGKAVFKSPRSRLINDLFQMKKAMDVIEKKPAKIITHSQFAKDALDLINSPPHYKTGGVETIDFIESKDLNYRLGNVIKYVSRAGRKATDPVEDLKKAAWYLNREINARENA